MSADFAHTAAAYFRDLQSRICAAFEAFEPVSRFESRSWRKPEGHRLEGGGESRLMRGAVFEKVGVNVSHVWGVFPAQARGQVAGAEDSEGKFVACGISLVAHMSNPYVPTVHMNLRYLRTSRAWFGGGSDLTPTFPFAEDTAQFHDALREACDSYRPEAYREFKEWCDRYFICRIGRSRAAWAGFSSTNCRAGSERRFRLRTHGRRGTLKGLSADRRAPQRHSLRRRRARAAAHQARALRRVQPGLRSRH